MARALPLAVLAASAAILACSTPPQTGGPAVPNGIFVTLVHPYEAGNGVVQSVIATPVMAGAGSSSEPLQRLEIKMDSGLIQYVDTPSRDFTRGMRVTLTEDKLIKPM